MAFAVGDLVQSRHVMYAVDQLGLNIVHHQVLSTAGLGASILEVAIALDNKYAPLYKPLLTPASAWRGTGTKQIKPPPTSGEFTNVANAGPGTGPGTIPMPKQVSGIITKQGVTGGRHGRGRLYIPFPSVGFGDTDGTPTAAYNTLLNTLAAALLTDTVAGTAPNTTTFGPVIWDRAINGANRVAAFRANDKWATQRRRGNYGRLNQIPF